MTYKSNKYGITKIKDDKFDKITVSWDYDDDENDPAQRQVTFLYTPDMDDLDASGCPDHSHIQLSQKQAYDLKEWLDSFFADINALNRDKYGP